MKDHLSVQDSHLLKGLAISAVLAIHILAQVPGKLLFTTPTNCIIVLIDQLSRFCVPLFVALSGYGFARKYESKPVDTAHFLFSRSRKLLPLYVVWSVIFWAVIPRVPQWYSGGDGTLLSYLFGIVFGGADYQMYFVPMIFQLYLVFPILWSTFKKHSHILMISSIVIQLLIYAWYSKIIGIFPTDWNILSETYQYLLFTSWIGYFVLGMWLAKSSFVHRVQQLKKFAFPTSVILVVFAAAYSTRFAFQQIAAGVDPLLSMRFTQWSVALFASLCIVSGIVWVDEIKKNLPVLQKPISWLGEHSFLIFLSHTLLLRIAVSWWRGILDLPTVLTLFAFFVLAFVFSIEFQKRI